MDFAGPVEGKMYLIAVDAFSKWPEVVIMVPPPLLKQLMH